MNLDRQKLRRFFFGPGALIIIFGYVIYAVASFFSDFELCLVPDDAVRIDDSVYHTSGGKIYSEGKGVQYVDGAFGCPNPFTLVPSADPISFTTINRMYGKDENNVFFYEKEIPVDPKTATSVRSEISSRDFRDAESVTYRTSEYVKDAESVFFRLRKIEGIKAENASLFSFGKEVFLRDKQGASFKGEILIGANPDNLKIKSISADNYDSLIYDEDQVWIIETYSAIEIDRADPATIEYLGEGSYFSYFRDSKSIFFYKYIVDVDRETFEVLSHGFVRDKNGVYCHEVLRDGSVQKIQILGVDPYTFAVLNRKYAKDLNNAYFINCTFANNFSRVIEGADVQSFEALSETEAQDKDYVYEGENQTRKRW